jgi:PAS domain S-box-containing protein
MSSRTSRSIIAGIVLAILAALASVLISLQQSKRLNDTAIAIEHTRQILFSSQQVLLKTVEIETAGRGFLLTGEKDWIDTVRLLIHETEKELNNLSHLTKDNPAQQKKVQQVKNYVDIRIASTLNHIAAKEKKDESRLRQLLAQGVGKSAMTKIRYWSNLISADENKLLNEKKAANATAYQQLKYIYYLTLGIIFISLIILGLRIIDDYNQRKKNIKELEVFNDRLAKEVQEKTAEIQSVFERVSDAFVALDNNWCYTYTNSRANEIFGKPPGYLIGKHIWTEFPEGINQPFYLAYYRAMKTQQYEYIEEYYPPYDLWFENHIYPSPTGLSIYFRDITAKKKAEQSIKATNERFELITKATNDVVWDWDVKNDKMWWNDNFYSYFGYEKHNIPSGIDSWIDNLYQEDKEKTVSSLYVAIENKQTLWQGEYRFIKADGSIIQLYDRGFSLLDSNGEVYRMVGSMIDITDQKNAQAQITKEKELSDSLINSLPGVFYLYDDTGKFIRWNKNFEIISEYSGSEIINMHPLQFFKGAEKKILEQRIKKVFEVGYADVEASFVTKSGKEIPFYFNGWRIQYEAKTCLIGVGIDITERKKAQDHLIKSEEKYRILFQNNPMPMWMYDIENLTIIDVNEAAQIHYGYTRAEFVGMSILKLRPEEDVPLLLETQKEDKKGIKFNGIWRHLKKDGTLIKVNITSYTINYEGRNCRLILSQDVTEKVKAEEDLNNSNKQLRELSAYLSSVREEERKHIAREIHDELGQQVTGIKIDISLLRKKIIALQPALEQEFLQVSKLLDDTVKTIRRISSELRPSMLDDIGLMAALQWQCAEFQRRSGITCTYTNTITENISFDPDTTTVAFRILQESMTNILRHAQATEVSVIVAINSEDDSFNMKIIDNGVGFDVTTTKNTFGLLGMQERANMINGKFSITSNSTAGTITILSIPLPTN